MHVAQDEALTQSSSYPTGGDIAALLQGYSIEIIPSNKGMVDTARRMLPAGTEVSITSLPNIRLEDVVSTAKELADAGLIPVPHIAARSIKSSTSLKDHIAALSQEAGVERALLIAGDTDDVAGQFESSFELMQTGLFETSGFKKLYVSTYPEGHPRISDHSLREARAAKIAYARDANIELHLISQFCFDPASILKMIKDLRESGFATPVRIGVAGPASKAALMKYALLCGVGRSLRFLGRNASAVKKMAADETPRNLLEVIAKEKHVCDRLGVAGVHFFTFGSLNKTINWIEEQRQN